MLQANKPKITAIERKEAQATLSDLIRRSKKGEEIIITEAGKPVAMLISPEDIRVLSSVGAIYYELPFEMGGFGWFGPPGSKEAKQQAREAYQDQFEMNLERRVKPR